MPVTITRPGALLIRLTAAANDVPSPSWIAAISAVMPPASTSSVRTAEASSSRTDADLGVNGATLDMGDAALLQRIPAIARIAGRNEHERGGQLGINHIRFNSVNQRSRPSAPQRWQALGCILGVCPRARFRCLKCMYQHHNSWCARPRQGAGAGIEGPGVAPSSTGFFALRRRVGRDAGARNAACGRPESAVPRFLFAEA